MILSTLGEERAGLMVRRLVSGVPSPLRQRRRFMILRAYIDDSYDNHVFVLGGYVGTTQQFERMADEWMDALKAFGFLPELHMAEFWQRFGEKSKERLEPFISIAERNSLYEVSAFLDMKDFQRVCDIYGMTGMDADPYYAILNLFTSGFSKAMLDGGIHEKVDLVFDRQSQKKRVLKAWDAFIETAPPAQRNFIRGEPRYEDSEEFMPLQAADMLAWWARKRFAVDRFGVTTGSLYPWRQPRDDHGYRIRIAIKPWGTSKTTRRGIAKTIRKVNFMRNGIIDPRLIISAG